jgi:dCTP deaminase
VEGDPVTLLRKEDLVKAMSPTTPMVDRLVVTPMLDPDVQVGPASIDLRLGSDFLLARRAEGSGIDPADDDELAIERTQERTTVPLGEPFWLHPQQFALGATLEFIRMPTSLGAYVVGRSSWGRIGLIVATAIVVQPGYHGALTFELVNEGERPIALYPGLRIAQLSVHELTAKTEFPYEAQAKYVSAIGPEPPKLAWDANEVKRMKLLRDRLSKR